MSGTLNGAQKAHKTILTRYGQEWISERGRKGGKVGGRKGFAAMPPEKRAAAGRKGGQISRRYQ